MAAKSEAWLAMSSQFAKLQSDASFTFAELRARTVSEAERAERLILLKQEEAERRARARATADIDTEIYGVNIDHECFVRDFTERTFLEYPVEDGDDELDETWKMDEWERDHAEACMAVVPELATLRFALCRDPAHHLLTPGAEPMSEARFWRTYFRMCGWRLALAEASFKARAAARARGIEVADDDPFPVEVDKAELEAFGFRVDDELLDQAAELIAEDLDEILGEEGEIQQARIERERAKKAEWLRTRKEWKPPDGSESPGGLRRTEERKAGRRATATPTARTPRRRPPERRTGPWPTARTRGFWWRPPSSGRSRGSARLLKCFVPKTPAKTQRIKSPSGFVAPRATFTYPLHRSFTSSP